MVIVIDCIHVCSALAVHRNATVADRLVASRNFHNNNTTNLII